jgi:hypothetical protein
LSLPYIGDTRSAKENKRKEYIQYLNPSQDSSSSPFRPEAMAEFKDSLRALSLNADDVDGIREVGAGSRCLVHYCMSLSNRLPLACRISAHRTSYQLRPLQRIVPRRVCDRGRDGDS